MKKINIFYEINRASGYGEDKENLNSKDIFFKSEKSFSQLDNKENIPKELVLKQIKEFQEKTGKQGEQILNNLQNFLEQNKLSSVKGYLATMLFVENLIEKKGAKSNKIINLLKNKKQALLLKLIKNFFDDVSYLITNYLNLKKKENNLKKNENNSKKLLNNQGVSVEGSEKNFLSYLNDVLNTYGIKIKRIHFETDTIKLSELAISRRDLIIKEFGTNWENKTLSDLVNRYYRKKIEDLLNQSNPKLNQQIKFQASKLRQTYPEISPDQAYLITFSYFYQKDPALQKELKLDSQDLAIIQSVKEKFGYIAKALTFVEVDNNFNQQTETLASNYDDKLKNSLEVKDLKVKNDYVLKILKINTFKERTEKDLNTDYEVFVKYLQNPDKEKFSSDKLNKFEKEKQKLFKKYINSFQEEYLSSYKTTAMKIYLNEVFGLFDKTLQSKYVEKTQNGFESTKDGLKINFKYRDVPLTFNIENDGKIKLKTFAKQEKGSFKVGQEQINEVFTFTSLNELFTPEKINPTDFLDKDWKYKLQNSISENISKKIEKNNALGNTELMKTETLFSIKQEFVIYNLLKFYKPPFEDLKNYEAGNSSLTENTPGLYHLITYSLNTINFKDKGEEVLTKMFTNNHLKKFLANLNKSSIEGENKMSTFSLFSKLNLISKIEGSFNIKRLNKFIETFAKKDIQTLNTEFQLENYDWELKNNKIILKEKQNKDEDIDETILSRIDPINVLKTDLA